MVRLLNDIPDLRYAPIACCRCRRHAAIYDLRYPRRVSPPSKNPMEYLFDIHDAKRYVLLKDVRKKISTTGEIIDLTPYIEDDDRSAKRQHMWTPESETNTPPAMKQNKHKRNQPKQKELSVKPPQRSKKKKNEKKITPKPGEALRDATPAPRLSEYEKMQLLIATAESEANSSSQRPIRLRRTSPTEPEKTIHQKESPNSSTFTQHSKRRTVEALRSVSQIDAVVAANVIKSPTSPKIAVYDEWQELVKNAQKQGEAGEGRSKRSKRPLPAESDPPASPRKHPKTQPSSTSGLGARAAAETISSITEDAVYKHESADVKDLAATCACEANHCETILEMAKSGEKKAEESKGEIVHTKTRRNIRSLGGDEIYKVKSEMATVQGRYLNNVTTFEEPPYVADENYDTKAKPAVTEIRRKSLPLKPAEAEILEENRLFMFAILATEGVMGNHGVV
jgi:hypothetical protein